MNYPSALHLKVKRAVADVILTIKAQHPQYTDESMEIAFVPVKHTHLSVRLASDDAEALPEAAHAAYEDDCA